MMDATELFNALGVPQGVRPGESMHWLLPGDGRSVLCELRWDREESAVVAEATETVPGGGNRPIAWVRASYDPKTETFAFAGEDSTGEGSSERDPSCAAAAFRRQILMIEAAGGRIWRGRTDD